MEFFATALIVKFPEAGMSHPQLYGEAFTTQCWAPFTNQVTEAAFVAPEESVVHTFGVSTWPFDGCQKEIAGAGTGAVTET